MTALAVIGERERTFFGQLRALYQRELRDSENLDYIRNHAEGSSISRQIEVFERYLPYVADCCRILDWGCHHAPDSCLLRMALGDSVSLHGCDVFQADRFAHFHDFAGLEFRQLNHVVQLPYGDGSFDAVVGSGVLEHAAMDFESLKELHRVLVDGGRLVITFLPNACSYTEFFARSRGLEAHNRLYGRREALRMLRHHGFKPLHAAYHQFLPAHRMQSLLGRFWPLNRTLERVWPLRLLCANLMVVAEKRSIM